MGCQPISGSLKLCWFLWDFASPFKMPAATYSCRKAHPWIRERIMALFSMALMGLMPLGAFILGIATRYAVVSRALMSAGIVCAISALAVVATFAQFIKAAAN
jgi:hypothetical protein